MFTNALVDYNMLRLSRIGLHAMCQALNNDRHRVFLSILL